MTDENPEVVAAANLSPVSPRPLHNTYTLPQVLPDLQHQAENPDVVPLEPTTFRTAAAAMAAAPDNPEAPIEPTAVADVDAVAESDDASIPDNESFGYSDADGEDGQEHGNAPQDAPQSTGDEYANTFDSPGQEQGLELGVETEPTEERVQQEATQEIVSQAPESMNICEQPDQPDAVPTQSAPRPAQPVSADAHDPSLAATNSQPTQTTAALSPNAASEPQPIENGSAPMNPVAAEAVPNVISSTSEAAQQRESPQPSQIEPNVQLEQTAVTQQDGQGDQTQTKQALDVQPTFEDVEMTADSPGDGLDIQQLVDQITAKVEATEEPATKPATLPRTSPVATDVDVSSLPPKPALTQEQSKQTYSPATYHHSSLPSAPSFATSTGAPPPPPFASSGAPGVSQAHSFNATPAFASYPNAYPPGTTPQPPAPGQGASGIQQTYDEFLADERKHMAEAKWERFPEGSRIFIGNLSQERVSKRDVFELFHLHGRLAQISLKSAYGFVQYHTVADAQSAMNTLQGAEVKGRKINLEISRTQKTKKDRDHSPAGERRGRGERGGRNPDRNGDRYDGRNGGRRDDFRQGRSPSPRRGDHRARQEPYSRDRGHHDAYNRKRSRSPDPYQRHDAYRRRSPSPYGRGRQEADQLDIPRRYGNDVPDVQILLMQEVHNDFVDWVQRAFWERGLKTNAMFLNPRFPRDAVIQRQVLEGVHGVVELDVRAQTTAKISLQVFDRSAGSNARFDQYQELDPPIAAQLVVRTKASAAQPPAYPPQLPPAGYPAQAYGVPPAYPPYQPLPTQQPPAPAQDLSSLVGQLSQMPNVDPSTLQTILASLQQPAQSHAPHVPIPMGHPHHGGPQPGQVDLNALISNVSAAYANSGQPAMSPGGVGGGMPGYPAGAAAYQQNNYGPGASDPARDVENIMATFARYRQ